MAEHFVEDERGYLRPQGAWREWLLSKPHLARDDGGAFFFVVAFEPRQLHAEYRVAAVCLLYVNDDLVVELRWREHRGLEEPGEAGCRYGFPKGEILRQYEITSERFAHNGREFNVRKIPEHLTRNVADAAVEAWSAWPVQGSRTIFGDAGDRLMNELWYTIPYALRPRIWTQSLFDTVTEMGLPMGRIAPGAHGATTPAKAVSTTDDWLVKRN